MHSTKNKFVIPRPPQQLYSSPPALTNANGNRFRASRYIVSAAVATARRAKARFRDTAVAQPAADQDAPRERGLGYADTPDDH